MQRNKTAPQATCLRNFAEAILRNRPLPHTLKALSAACGLTLEEQRQHLGKVLLLGYGSYGEHVINSGQIALRGRQGGKIDRELSRDYIAAMADMLIHEGYDSKFWLTGNNDAPMLRCKFIAAYFQKLEVAIADEEKAKPGPLVHGHVRHGVKPVARYGATHPADSVYDDRHAPKTELYTTSLFRSGRW